MNDTETHNSIVIVNQEAGYLTIDIANRFAEEYNQCILIAGRIIQRIRPLNNRIICHRLIRYRRNRLWLRVLSWIVAFIQILFLLWFRYPRSYLFIISNPPIATLLPLMTRKRFSLLIFDVYPDALSEFGILSDKSILVKWWRAANKKSYNKASHIYTISEGMKRNLEQYVEQKKIEVISLWTGNEPSEPIPRDKNPFIRKHQLEHKFLVLYSGNIGYSQQLDILIEIASKIEKKEIFFVIIGEGIKKKELADHITSLKLENCIVLPWQSPDNYVYALSAAHIGVVYQGRNASRLSLPSKLYDYVSAGVPLLSIAEKGSDLDLFVNSRQIGKSFDPTNNLGIFDFIMEVSNMNGAYYNFLCENSRKLASESTFQNSSTIRL